MTKIGQIVAEPPFTDQKILPFVTANGVLPRVILCCWGRCTEGTQCRLITMLWAMMFIWPHPSHSPSRTSPPPRPSFLSAKEHRVPLMRPRDGPPLLDTLFTLVHRPTGHTSPWSDCPLLHVTGGAVPVVRGGPVRIGRPQCPMLNGRCLCTGSDAEEVWVQKNVTERQILPFVTANGVLPRVILCCRGWWY